MGKVSQPTARKYDSQELDNWEHDHTLRVKKIMAYEQDGASAIAPVSKLVALKVTVSGSVTYVAKAPIASSQASAVWQAKKIDSTTGVIVTWADGNGNFDNIATDLTALSYS